ncbi:FK506-binding protein [Echinococcus granulosus]|uniref:peptidylprolyl isomerase n=1 Tax=Echinococcus granulosus TaxID=6210 RepID=W6U938_ECHGR|nr:FK506-binding protein [Echinococcus granulosus]EUB54992.1 FK506-binding protein [Echinococcus granulosus]
MPVTSKYSFQRRLSSTFKNRKILYVPCSKFVQKGDYVHVLYTGWLYETKKQFDSNVGGEPIRITVSAGQVIAGWEEGLIGTCEGERRRLRIPSSMGYGERGYGNLIPPDSDLEFDIEMVRIDKRKKEF